MRMLMIEDNEDDFILFTEHLLAYPKSHFETFWCSSLAEGIRYLETANANIDVLLLDMGLPDSQGLDTFNAVQARFPHLPVVIISGLDNDESAIEAVRRGAQDYLVKGQISGPLLARAVQYALERKVIEEALLAGEEQYRKVVEDQTELIYRYDANLTLTFVNGAYCKTYGKQMRDVLGHSYLEEIPAADHAIVKAHIASLNAANPVATVEHPSGFPDGSIRWFEWTDRALLDEYGHIFEYQGVGRDITPRKKAEAELAEYRDHLEQLVEQRTAELNRAKGRVEAILNNSIDGILLAYADSGIQQSNDAFSALFACEPNHYFGRPLLELAVEDDRAQLAALIHSVSFDRIGGHVEIRALRKDGTTFEAQIGLGFINSGNIRGDGLVCSISDISERKERERQLRYHASLQENVADAVISTDLNFIIQSWNRAAERIYGWTAEEVVGKHNIRVLQAHFESEQKRANVLQTLLKQAYASNEVIQQRKDGTLLYVIESIYMIKDVRGESIGIVEINRDMTERKFAEQEQKKKAEEERLFQTYLKELHEISIELTAIDQLDDFYKHTVEAGLSRLGFERLALFLYDAENSEAIGTYGTDIDGRLVSEQNFKFKPAPDNIIMRTFQGSERFCFDADVPLYTNRVETGYGWNAAAALWNGSQSIGWLVADNATHHTPATKPLLDILSLYAMTVGTLLARKQVEASLRQSEANLQSVLNSTSVGIVLVDRNSVVRLANQLAQEYGLWLYNRPLEMGKTRLMDLDITDRGAGAAVFQKVFAGERRVHELSREVDAQFFTLDVRYDPVTTPAGEVVGAVVSFVNITERKRIEIAQRESEEKFRRLMDAAPVAVVISSQTGRITLVNDQAETLFGYLREELVGEPIEVLVPDQFRGSHMRDAAAYIESPIARKMGTGGELFAQRKDRSQFPVEIDLSYIQTQTGVLVMSFIVDITDRKERERQLRYQASLQENVTDAVIATDLNLTIQSWNRAATRIYGWAADEVIGKSLWEVLHTQFVSDSAQEITAHDFMGEDYVSSDALQRHKDGRQMHTNVSAVMFKDEKGNPLGIVEVSHDITERKHAENALREQHEFLQQVINNVPGLIMVKDRAGRFQLANRLTAQIFGLTPATMIGKMGADLETYRTQIAFLLQDDQQVLETGQSSFIPEQTILDNDYQISKIPLMNQDSVIDRLLVVASDITERKRAEETLRQAFEKEKELGELKSRFVSMASHEFRTPLATILAVTDTLGAYRHKMSNEQIDQRLVKIRVQIRHLTEIMDDVLHLARMQEGKVPFEPSALDFADFCQEIIDEFRSQSLQTHNIVYSNDNRPLLIRADRKLMRQIVSNLLTNAIKYSPLTKIVHVTLSRGDGCALLSVADTGIGIPESDLKRLFEPFHRASNVGTISGTGLGLTIMKESVERHGGSISVESQVDVGTTFIIRIPADGEE